MLLQLSDPKPAYDAKSDLVEVVMHALAYDSTDGTS